MSNVARILLSLMHRADGISENELARRTGVPQSTINRILSGVSRDPKTGTLQPLADYFGVTVAQLRGEASLPGGKDDPLERLLTPRELALLRLFGVLTDGQQDEVLRSLEVEKQRNEAIYVALQRRKERGAA